MVVIVRRCYRLYLRKVNYYSTSCIGGSSGSGRSGRSSAPPPHTTSQSSTILISLPSPPTAPSCYCGIPPRHCHHHHIRPFSSSSSSSSSFQFHEHAENKCVTTLVVDDDDDNDDEIVTMTQQSRRGSEYYQLALDAIQHSSRIHKLREERLLSEQFEAMERQRQKKMKGQQPNNAHVPIEEEEDSVIGMTKDRAAGMAVIRTIVKQSQNAAAAAANNGTTTPAVKVERYSRSSSSGGGGRDSNDGATAVVGDAILACHGQHPHPGSSSSNNNNKHVEKSSEDDEYYWQNLARQYMEESALRYGYGLALVRLGNDALERAKEEEEETVEDASSSATSRTLPFFFDMERCKHWIDESPIPLDTILDLNINGRGCGDTNMEEDYDDETTISRLSYHRQLALHLYAAAGKRGSAEGYYNHGHILWDANKYTRAMISFYKAMELGDSDAMYFVAAQYLSYEENDGTVDDVGEEEKENGDFSFMAVQHEQHGSMVMEILQKSNAASMKKAPTTTSISMAHPIQQHGLVLLQHAAHECRHGPALHHLALLHNEHGDVQSFSNYLTEAADMDHPDSLFLRGHCRYFGTDGFDRDVSAAMADFILAADSGHVDAMVSGALLHRGVVNDQEDGTQIIIPRDQRRAFELYQRAGELGSMEGWRNVVSCYATGEGVPMCMDTAKYIAKTMLKENK